MDDEDTYYVGGAQVRFVTGRQILSIDGRGTKECSYIVDPNSASVSTVEQHGFRNGFLWGLEAGLQLAHALGQDELQSLIQMINSDEQQQQDEQAGI
jgi:hypothetical protein